MLTQEKIVHLYTHDFLIRSYPSIQVNYLSYL
jgi:hypothetical protein